MYKIARVVCFDQGMRRKKPTETKMLKLPDAAEEAAKLGFEEIQLTTFGMLITGAKVY